MEFTPSETENLKKAFENKEFLKIFSEYVEEISDPVNRKESEMYIRTLEKDQKVPIDKICIHPKSEYVVKTKKKDNKTSLDEKLFINIVSSDNIQQPNEIKEKGGSTWSLPYTVGPPHMEKDKTNINITCFDCCYHPQAIQLSYNNKSFQDMLIKTSLEGVQSAYNNMGQSHIVIDSNGRVLKGVQYMSGEVGTMMIKKTDQQKWAQEQTTANTNTVTASPTSITPIKGTTDTINKENKATATVPTAVKNPASTQKGSPGTAVAVSPPIKADSGLFKKGFLSGSSSASKSSAKKKNEVTTTGTPPIPTTATATVPAASQALLSPAANGGCGDEEHTALDTLTMPGSAPASSSSAAASLIQEVTTPTPPRAPTKTTATSSEKSTINPPLPPVATPSSLLTPISTTQKPSSIQSTTTPTSTPPLITHTLTERGVLSLGDFPALSRAQGLSYTNPTLPAELIYRFSIPDNVKPTQLDLDVSPMLIKLSYPLLNFELSLKTTYEVEDKKGTAKYDKKSKVLTVTLPVKVPPYPSPSSSSSSTHPTDTTATAADECTVVDTLSREESHATETTTTSLTTTTTAAANVIKVSKGNKKGEHNRWVDNTQLEQQQSKQNELKQEITQKSNANTNTTLPSSVTTPAENVTSTRTTRSKHQLDSTTTNNTTNANTTTNTTSQYSTAHVPVQSTAAVPGFTACPQFIGARPGYIYTTRETGTGYYIDKSDKQVIPNQSPGTVSTLEKAEKGQNYDHFKYEVQETDQNVAMIIQVPHIIPSSVSICCTQGDIYPLLHIQFKAIGGHNSDPSSSPPKQYGMSFALHTLTSLLFKHANTNSNTTASATTTITALPMSASKENTSLTTNTSPPTTTTPTTTSSSTTSSTATTAATATSTASSAAVIVYDVAGKNMVIVINKAGLPTIDSASGSAKVPHNNSSSSIVSVVNHQPYTHLHANSTDQPTTARNSSSISAVQSRASVLSTPNEKEVRIITDEFHPPPIQFMELQSIKDNLFELF